MRQPTELPNYKTILIAPDKFKGSLSAREVTEAMARACHRVFPGAEIIHRPLADGGEGSLELLREVLPLRSHRLTVPGPMKKPVEAHYLLGDGKAYIETASACGLQYVPPHRREPGRATTIGVGMLIDDALARGAREVYLFLGGSATNDCGAGLAGALGYRFLSDRGHDFIPTGDSLGYTDRIDLAAVTERLHDVRFVAVCDVDNPLLGPEGATHVYAPQKGASPVDIPSLEDHMSRFAAVVERDLNVSIGNLPGAGAAGGMGGGCVAFLGAEIRSGIDLLLEAVDFPTLLSRAGLVLTGEGKIDDQTLRGKVVSGVGEMARVAGVPAFAFGGVRSVGAGDLPGFSGVHAIMDDPAMTTGRAMSEAGDLLEDLVVRVLSGWSG